MGDYDKVIKENIEAIFAPILEKLLNISVAKSYEIKDKVQTTIEPEPDFLKRVIDHDGKQFILQIEFQTTNDPDMVYRMAEYKAILQRKFRIPVNQYVIYLGSGSPTMKTLLSVEEQITGFHLTNIKDLPTKSTLNSKIPEEIILTVLGDYPKSNASGMVDSILNRLKQVAKDEASLLKAVQQLLVLSRLRNLDDEIEQKVDNMPITYDIKTDRLYNKGVEEGKELTKIQMISKALELGLLNVEQIAEMANVPTGYVVSIQTQLQKKEPWSFPVTESVFHLNNEYWVSFLSQIPSLKQTSPTSKNCNYMVFCTTRKALLKKSQGGQLGYALYKGADEDADG